MMRDTQARLSLPRTGWHAMLALAQAIMLAGCVTAGANWTPPAGSTGQYRQIIVVPMLADTLDLVQPGKLLPPLILQPAGWNTPVAAVDMVRQLLAPLGTDVITAMPAGLPRPGQAGMRWPQNAWTRLAENGSARDAPVILLLHQNAITSGGTECNLLTTLAGQSCIDDPNFQPAFIVAQNVGLDRAIAGEEARCLIGLDARLLDARTGQTIGAVNSIIGLEWRPHGLADAGRISEEEREALRPYCLSALRKALAAAIRDLPIFTASGSP